MMHEYQIYLNWDEFPIFVWADNYQIQGLAENPNFFCFYLDGEYTVSFPVHHIKKIMREHPDTGIIEKVFEAKERAE